MHTGRMIREEPFTPELKEKQPILAGFEKWDSPPAARLCENHAPHLGPGAARH
jgi:hypothetical protein